MYEQEFFALRDTITAILDEEAAESRERDVVAVEGTDVFYDKDSAHWMSQNVNVGLHSRLALDASNELYEAGCSIQNRKDVQRFASKYKAAKLTSNVRQHRPRPVPTSVRATAAATDKLLETDHESYLQRAGLFPTPDPKLDVVNYDNGTVLKEMFDRVRIVDVGIGTGTTPDGGTNDSDEDEEKENLLNLEEWVYGRYDSDSVGKQELSTHHQESTDKRSSSTIPDNAASMMETATATDPFLISTDTDTAAAAEPTISEEGLLINFLSSMPAQLAPTSTPRNFRGKRKIESPIAPKRASGSEYADHHRVQLKEMAKMFRDKYGVDEAGFWELQNATNPLLARSAHQFEFGNCAGLCNALLPNFVPFKLGGSNPVVQLYLDCYKDKKFNVYKSSTGLIVDPSRTAEMIRKADHTKYAYKDMHLRSKFIADDMVLTAEFYHRLIPEQRPDSTDGCASNKAMGSAEAKFDISEKELASAFCHSNTSEALNDLTALLDSKSASEKHEERLLRHSRHKKSLHPELCLEVESLISGSIQDLCRLFFCEQDFVVKSKVTTGNIGKMTHLKNRDLSKDSAQLLQIGNCVYCDVTNDNTVEEAIRFLEYLDTTGRAKSAACGPFILQPWTLPLSSLNLRFGFPYSYIHQTNCEHRLVFTQCRVPRAGETQILKESSQITQTGVLPTRMCARHPNEIARFMAKRDHKCQITTTYACSSCAESIASITALQKSSRPKHPPEYTYTLVRLVEPAPCTGATRRAIEKIQPASPKKPGRPPWKLQAAKTEVEESSPAAQDQDAQYPQLVPDGDDADLINILENIPYSAESNNK